MGMMGFFRLIHATNEFHVRTSTFSSIIRCIDTDNVFEKKIIITTTIYAYE